MKKYPFIKQEGIKDCGVTCLSMIIEYYKGYVPMEKLREMTNTTKKGCNAYYLVETAKKLGFNAKGVKVNLKDTSNIVLPCIAHVTIDNSFNHYIVIYKIDYKKEELIIADPATKLKKIKFEEFNKIYNNILLIMFPIKKIPLYAKPISFGKFTFNLIKIHKIIFFQILLLSIFITITSIIGSFYFKYMIDNISSEKKDLLSFIFIFFIFISMLKIITDFFRNKLLIIINQKIEYSLITDIFKSIMSLPYHYFKNRTTGEIISRINDLSIIKEMISKVAITILIDLALTISTAVILFYISPKLFLISFIILILYFIIVLIFRKIFDELIENIQQEKSLLNSFMVESISGFETVKGLSIEKNLINKFEKANVLLLKKHFKYENIYNLEYFLKELVTEIGQAIIIFTGCLLVIEKTITLGELIAYISLLIYFLTPIRNIIDLNKNIKEAKNSLKRISEIIIKEEDNKIIKEGKFKNIEFKNLNYNYNEENILKNINLKINKGKKIMLVGPSGSGKSTLLKLLKGYYKVNNNMILIDGIDINNYKKSIINKNITYVSQNENLFTDTLYNNLKLDRNIKEKEILKIMKLCFVDQIIKNNNLGLNMIIEENGFNISGGEKQRIVLARSLLNNFEILILDESLSQIDINLERKILKNIFNNYKNKTIIFVSHRYDNLDLFDSFINLEDGVIKEVNQKSG